MKTARITVFALACMLMSCSQAPEYQAEDRPNSGSEQASSVKSGPAIDPTAAPGVAFNYAYQFRLPHTRIAQVQEVHALACEKLGTEKCRITGLQYTVMGESEIQAMLAVKLAPEIARQFGKSGIAAVEKAEGMMVATEISGTDVSSAISAARQNEDEIARQVARLEAQLVNDKLPATTRAELTAQIENLRSTKRENVASRVQNEDSLANTPMVFSYASGGLIPGFDARSPIRDALQTAVNVLVGILSFLIVATAFLVPLLLFLAAIMLIWRRIKPVWYRWMGNTDATEG